MTSQKNVFVGGKLSTAKSILFHFPLRFSKITLKREYFQEPNLSPSQPQATTQQQANLQPRPKVVFFPFLSVRASKKQLPVSRK